MIAKPTPQSDNWLLGCPDFMLSSSVNLLWRASPPPVTITLLPHYLSSSLSWLPPWLLRSIWISLIGPFWDVLWHSCSTQWCASVGFFRTSGGVYDCLAAPPCRVVSPPGCWEGAAPPPLSLSSAPSAHPVLNPPLPGSFFGLDDSVSRPHPCFDMWILLSRQTWDEIDFMSGRPSPPAPPTHTPTPLSLSSLWDAPLCDTHFVVQPLSPSHVLACNWINNQGTPSTCSAQKQPLIVWYSQLQASRCPHARYSYFHPTAQPAAGRSGQVTPPPSPPLVFFAFPSLTWTLDFWYGHSLVPWCIAMTNVPSTCLHSHSRFPHSYPAGLGTPGAPSNGGGNHGDSNPGDPGDGG